MITRNLCFHESLQIERGGAVAVVYLIYCSYELKLFFKTSDERIAYLSFHNKQNLWIVNKFALIQAVSGCVYAACNTSVEIDSYSHKRFLQHCLLSDEVLGLSTHLVPFLIHILDLMTRKF